VENRKNAGQWRNGEAAEGRRLIEKRGCCAALNAPPATSIALIAI